MKYIIAVDLQNDFIFGSLGTPEAKEVHERVIKYFNSLSDNTKVIFTQDTHEPDYLTTAEGIKLPVKHCIKHTHGWKINEEIWNACKAPKEIISKKTFGSYDLPNCLMNSILDSILEEDGYPEEIEIFGLCTDICVISNCLILKAYYPEAKITVRPYLCAGTTPEAHDAALSVMKSCQIDLV